MKNFYLVFVIAFMLSTNARAQWSIYNYPSELNEFAISEEEAVFESPDFKFADIRGNVNDITIERFKTNSSFTTDNSVIEPFCVIRFSFRDKNLATINYSTFNAQNPIFNGSFTGFANDIHYSIFQDKVIKKYYNASITLSNGSLGHITSDIDTKRHKDYLKTIIVKKNKKFPGYKIEFTWQDDHVAQITCEGKTIDYIYGSDGELASTVDSATGVTSTYEIVLRDRYGNWVVRNITSRLNNSTEYFVEKRNIKYYSNIYK